MKKKLIGKRLFLRRTSILIVMIGILISAVYGLEMSTKLFSKVYEFQRDRIIVSEGTKETQYRHSVNFGEISRINAVLPDEKPSGWLNSILFQQYVYVIGAAIDDINKKLLYSHFKPNLDINKTVQVYSFSKIFQNPRDLVLNKLGKIFVLDGLENQVYRFGYTIQNTDGPTAVTQEAVFGNGILNNPSLLSVDLKTNVLYVADSGNNRIVKFDGATGEKLTFYDQIASNIVLPVTDPSTITAVGLGTDYYNHFVVLDSGDRKLKVYAKSGILKSSFDLSSLGIISDYANLGLKTDGWFNVYVIDKKGRNIYGFATSADDRIEYLTGYSDFGLQKKTALTDMTVVYDMAAVSHRDGGYAYKIGTDVIQFNAPLIYQTAVPETNSVKLKLAYVSYVDLNMVHEDGSVIKTYMSNTPVKSGTTEITLGTRDANGNLWPLNNAGNRISDGVYEIRVKVKGLFDEETKAALEHSMPITIDYTPPMDFKIISPGQGSQLPPQSVTLTWEKTSDRDISRYQLDAYYWDAVNGRYQFVTLNDSIAPTHNNVTLTNMKETIYYFYLYAIDKAGNWRGSAGNTNTGSPVIRSYYLSFDQNQTILRNEMVSGTKVYTARNKLKVSEGFLLKYDARVIFRAGKEVELDEDFPDSEDGAVYETDINPNLLN